MTPRAITIRLAEPRDAQAIAMMSRDFIEAGLGWKYDAARVMRAIKDRETLAVVACESGKVEGEVDLEDASYCLSRITVVPSDEPTMRKWRKKLFVAISQNSGNLLAERFRLPVSRTVVMGSEIGL